MKRAIIFDLDGTLWDTTEQVELVWNGILKEYNKEFNHDQIKKIMGLTKEEICEYLFYNNLEFGNKFITECQKRENEYISKYGGNIYSNTIKTIKKLYKKYDLFIVSNCQTGYIEVFLEYYKLKKYFKDYESSGNTGKDKEFNIKMILEKNNIKNAVYIGDTKKDYIASKNNNLKFVWAKYGFGTCDCYDEYINNILDLCYKIETI